MSEKACGRTPERLQALLEAAARPHVPAPGLSLLAAGAALLGAVAFGLGLLLAPGAAWAAYLASWLFWTGVALGGLAVTASLHLTESRWGRVIERTATSLAGFLPLSILLLLPLPLGRADLWAHVPEAAERPLTIIGGALLRDGLLLAAVTVLAQRSLRRTVSPDEPPGAARPGKSRPAVMLVLFFLTGAFLALDLHLGLNPPFRSTVYPVLYLAGAYLSALALTAVALVCWRRAERLQEVIAPEDLLDLGNLVWSFVLFLGYLWWCQYLPIWMTNLPKESAYVLIRWRTWPWAALSYGALVLAVAVPGLLLSSRLLKKRERPLLLAAGCAAAGVLLQRMVDVHPTIPHQNGFLGWIVALGVTVGFAGLAGLCYLAVARRVPLFPVSDPKLLEALQVRPVKA